MTNNVHINGRPIGPDSPPYVVAEVSANHNGNLERALQTIAAAADCGVDAVKIQTYTPDTLTIDCDLPDFRIQGGLWDGYTLYKLYQWAQTPFEWHQKMFDFAASKGVTLFSTPFDESAVDLLEHLQAPAYKIASFEAVDIPLIRYVARTGKPMIISTGMADEAEIGEAVEAARSGGCTELILLHCISSYPAPVEQSNLRTIADMAERFGVVAGLSDHTLGTTVAIAAVAQGACFIEKHFTLSRADKGPDSEFSLEPSELRELCHASRQAWLALGKAGYERKTAEEANVKFRRSIYAVRDIQAGEEFSPENIRRIRPGYGLAPKYFEQVLGRRATQAIVRGSALDWHMVSGD
ncbi:pseudaminic acid synthase [Desulfurispirillum indicum]|uniref:Pseudaminic acid synthase n=1 Tax=Desulfurispirillum indicum (strain ATCC BAA-1389 / DSM 22839 / S5) TaxID=653733 RepID=E6W2M5_DESIS|nr:pseudaminic acid synthase [Desulfurispirillum indicum]ADU65609.1 pseudaminic acid synthase [Desulfurispirillum indicum S5]UCZ57556.1 pseudaminic acid synthase [Desulfurispirillum indicum]